MRRSRGTHGRRARCPSGRRTAGRGGADAPPVGPGRPERAGVDVDADDRLRTPEGGTECKHPGPTAQVDHQPSLDVTLQVRTVDEVGGEVGRRPVLFEVHPGVLESADDGQFLSEGALRHAVT